MRRCTYVEVLWGPGAHVRVLSKGKGAGKEKGKAIVERKSPEKRAPSLSLQVQLRPSGIGPEQKQGRRDKGMIDRPGNPGS